MRDKASVFPRCLLTPPIIALNNEGVVDDIEDALTGNDAVVDEINIAVFSENEDSEVSANTISGCNRSRISSDNEGNVGTNDAWFFGEGGDGNGFFIAK